MSADTSGRVPVEVADLVAGPVDRDRVYWVRPGQLTLDPNARTDAQIHGALIDWGYPPADVERLVLAGEGCGDGCEESP